MVVETDLYERLGVSHDATTDQIRRSYRQAALLWHPDRNRDDPETAAEQFKACLEAYEILSNPNQRTLYDAYGLSGVLRTAGDPEQSPEMSTRDARQQPRQPRQHHHQYRRPARPASSFHDSFFDDDRFFEDDDFFVFPQQRSTFPFEQNRPSQRQTQQARASQPRFSFSSSFTFSTSSSSGGGNGGGGTFTTHTSSWNSRDGHRSQRTSGTFGPDGVRHTTHRDDGHQVQDARERYDRNDRQDRQRAQERQPSSRSVQAQSQTQGQGQQVDSPFNMGGMGNLGGGLFQSMFSNMNNFHNFFSNNLFGEPEPQAHPQQSRRRQ